MGFFDDIFTNPFGGMFDLNGDGKEDLAEQWLGYKTMEELSKENEKELTSSPFSSVASSYSWRRNCEDGSEFGVFPEDFSTLEEYNEALKEAKHGWRDTVVDGTIKYKVFPEDYETEDEYESALKDAKEKAHRYDWRENAEEWATEYGLFPEDYENEDDYLETLEEIKSILNRY